MKLQESSKERSSMRELLVDLLPKECVWLNEDLRMNNNESFISSVDQFPSIIPFM